jgi:hypothetical protein
LGPKKLESTTPEEKEERKKEENEYLPHEQVTGLGDNINDLNRDNFSVDHFQCKVLQAIENEGQFESRLPRAFQSN